MLIFFLNKSNVLIGSSCLIFVNVRGRSCVVLMNILVQTKKIMEKMMVYCF